MGRGLNKVMIIGNLGRHPEDATQTSVAVFGNLAGSAEAAGLISGKIQTAELEELTMVVEAAQVAGFGQDG